MITPAAIDKLACCWASAQQDSEDNPDYDFSERSAAIASGLQDLTKLLDIHTQALPLYMEYMNEHHADEEDEEQS